MVQDLLDALTQWLASLWASLLTWWQDTVVPILEALVGALFGSFSLIVQIGWHVIWDPLTSLIAFVMAFLPSDNPIVNMLGMINWVLPLDTFITVATDCWRVFAFFLIIKIVWRLIPFVH